MTALLEKLFGRLPIGWLQLSHNKTRFAAALAGVSFANILVFMQLGFLGALMGTITLPYAQMNADILISSPDANTISDGSPLPRQRMYEALAIDGVHAATPLYFGRIDWRQPSGDFRNLDAIGVDPAVHSFRTPEINQALDLLKISNNALLDRGARNVSRQIFQNIDAGKPYGFETQGRSIRIASTFEIGGGFTTDGFLIVSDQTFFKLFPQRVAGGPNHILITIAEGADATSVAAALRAKLNVSDTKIRTIDEAISADQSYQMTQKPIGVIFGFGVIIGIIVGVIIVYQVLSSDVADHLREYATFKAIGYAHSYFLGIVFEEALILAICGFIPGFLISLILYFFVAANTGLPVAMTAPRAFIVLAGAIAMCSLSGAIATRRLARANPADLF